MKDSETYKELLSEYFKSNPKEWDWIEWEILQRIDSAKEIALKKGSGEFEKGIVEGIRQVLDMEVYYKTPIEPIRKKK